MENAHTDPSHLAVPFAELVEAASAWDDARGLIEDCAMRTRAQDATGFGPQVGPVLTERLDRWRAEVALLGDAVAAHADALRACAATSRLADAAVVRRFG
jgi:hypothetical protein